MLIISDLTLDAYGRRFIEGANLTLPPKSKTGLVGINGIGKSTLFKHLLGKIDSTTGHVSFPSNWRIGTVDQEIAASPQQLLDVVLDLDVRRKKLMHDLEVLPYEEHGEIHEQLLAIDAYTAPSRAAEILSGLGFKQSDLERPISDFSGGWRMRAALAGVLLAEPEILLLDEPTNYLDLEGIVWLKQKLKKYPYLIIIISHDRDLLNESVNQIAHLQGQKITLYSGNYDYFERARAENARLQGAQNAKIEAERAHLESFINRFRAKASKSTQAQSRLKRLEKLPPIVRDHRDQVYEFALQDPESSLPSPLMGIDEASIGYDQKAILKNITIRINHDDRIGILGVNGSGKSTMAKTIAGSLSLLTGKLNKDSRLKIGWFHQHQIEALNPGDTPLEIIRRRFPDYTESKRRALLGHFGFGADKVDTKCLSLSGGEKARLLLNLINLEKPHLLILDEPTNHLDIESRRTLIDAITHFKGAVIIIAHDRSMLEMVVDRFWLIKDGQLRSFDGTMDDYEALVLDEQRIRNRKENEKPENAQKSTINAKDLRKQNALKRQNLAPLKKQITTIEDQISNLKSKKDAQLLKISDSALHMNNPELSQNLSAEIKKIEIKINNLEEEWLNLSEQYEDAMKA